MKKVCQWLLPLILVSMVGGQLGLLASDPCRVRELGVKVGIFEPGKLNAITDVGGVRVGHSTLIRGADIRTGVTAILPHEGNLFREKVHAAVYVGNGFGKLMGSTQVEELGQIETPILLTATLNVPKVADALIDFMLGLPGMEDVRSINPVVGETNDGMLSDIRARAVGRAEVFEAIQKSASGVVEEGAVGAGTGTRCYGFKGGIGTSSRLLPSQFGGYTVGVLVQTNFGGVLEISGAPVGIELGEFLFSEVMKPRDPDLEDGSCMIVVATDAPMRARALKRLAKRAMLGMAATGSPSSHGSGDYVISFSTYRGSEELDDAELTPLFQAVKEATEEAIYNSLFMATTVVGRDGNKAEAIPRQRVVELLKKYRVIHE